MAIYTYEGKDYNGRKVKGELDVDSKSQAVSELRKQGIFPIKVQSKEETSKEINLSFGRKKVKNRELIIFCRQFAATLDAGISIIESLDILRQQTENKMLKEALDDVYNEVQKGLALSVAMKSHPKAFPTMLVNMVAAGEFSGALSDILHRMTEHYEKEDRISAKIKSATIYPRILAGVTIIVVTILLIFVLPNFGQMFADMGAELPGITQLLMNFGSTVTTYWYVPVGICVLIYLFYRRLNSTVEGRIAWDKWKLGLPIFGQLTRKVATSRFSRTLGAMLKSGIPIIEAMEQVIQVIGNKYVESELIGTLENIKRGEGIANPLSSINIFPPMLISMIRIGEETGTIDELLLKTSEFYDDEVERASTNMVQALNPLILLVMVAFILPVLIAIALPMFDMYNHMV
ncbi:type II secretion system F family protein [Acidaminobacter sp. JC074]|uniref:type II secretion system F family protein n=1 Tax=Acidaminobacter sp. JC074 TaxID=2530199 RepID=UPI001F0FC666|nr:type II secretion system F family protein [Acidaminobacter sp. JC074]MCH4888798.1 type II secretion system F family protein [Acidaminobacter sp. JC074]